MLAKALAHVGTAFVAMSLFELVEAILGFEKSSSDAELQEMLRGLKKTDLTQLCKKYQLKSSGNKPELIGRLLEKWKGQQRKRGRGIDGCRNFARKDTSYVRTGHELEQNSQSLSDFAFMDLYTYLVSSRNKTFDRESLKAFKSLKAYKYFADDLVRNVHAGHIPANDLVAIKAHCLSSLKASTTYFTFLAMKQNGTVVAAQCSCVAGQGEACSHVAALMFYLEDKMRQKDMHIPPDTSSTGRLQQWHLPPKRVVQPKSLKEISFRKAEYCKRFPSVSSESAVVTSTSVSLVTSPAADIVGLVSAVQKSVGHTGISHFWVKSETQTPGPASEAALAAAAQALILYSSGCPNARPASATDYADANTSAPYFLELCNTFTQGQTISQDVADYIHATTKDQATSALWLDLRNGRLTSSVCYYTEST